MMYKELKSGLYEENILQEHSQLPMGISAHPWILMECAFALFGALLCLMPSWRALKSSL